ncbi:MAG: response regulator [Thermomicrobiales bacterium]
MAPQSHAETATTATEDRPQPLRKHIFVINGTPAFLNLMRDVLQDERFNVTTTNYVPRSFNQIEALQPDALLVDVVVGQREGWDLLERLHAEASTMGIPTLVTSTSTALLERAEAQAERYGTHQYLAKPFDLNEFLACIEAMVGPA